MSIDPKSLAVILIGFQNDYFAADGVLNAAIEDQAQMRLALSHTLALLERLKGSEALFIEAPIQFQPGYEELVEPVGILKIIKDLGAFKAGTPGAETIPEIAAWGERIRVVPGKRGLNAFSNTALHALLQQRGVRHVAFAGIVTSLCIDSSARQSADMGYATHVLTDCICGRTAIEQQFYCRDVFPLYAHAEDSEAFLAQIGSGADAR